MSKRIITILLIVSLAFNIAVVTTMVLRYRRFHNNEQKEMLQHFQKMKKIHPEVHNKYKKRIKTINEDNRKEKIKFMQELVKENPDYDYLETSVEKIQAFNSKITKNIHEEMISLRKNISYQKAQEVFGFHLKNMKKERPGRRNRGHREGEMPPPPPEH